MEGGCQQGHNGGSVGGALRQDEYLVCWGEMVPSIGFLFCLALCNDDGEECFRSLQPSCYIDQDARDTRVVLWDSLGWSGKVGFGPPTEPYARAFFRAKRKWCSIE